MSNPGVRAEYQQAVSAYVAAGGDESVQQVITAIYQVTKKLDQWYDRQLADLGITHGDWLVLAYLAKQEDAPATPSALADAAGLAASSMTSRLDRMCAMGLVTREPDATKRTRVLVRLTDAGWDIFAQAVREANVVESDTLAALTTAQRADLAALLELVISGLDASG